jgi:hypothetical protein
MATPYRVGADVDAVCTKCRMLLGHTILAMVGSRPARVRCNTCDGEHNFRAPDRTNAGSSAKKGAAGSEARSATRIAVKRAAAPAVTSWEAIVRGRDLSRPRRYSVNERFMVNDVLDHPVFGLGVVREQRGDKVDVVFQNGPRTLMHGRA